MLSPHAADLRGSMYRGAASAPPGKEDLIVAVLEGEAVRL